MPQILFRNANLLDTESGRTLPGHSVLVEDERIVELRDGEIRAPDAQAIDVGGRTLMPGLIDAHVHAVITTMNLAAMAQRPLSLVAIEAAKVLEGMLRRGFTSVRDAGGADRGMAQAIERGLIAAPRLFYSGRALSQTGGHGDFGPLEDNDPAADGTDTDGDGLCDVGDGDDDNDGVLDEEDVSALNPLECRDLDADGCDDCSVGTDGFGPLPDFDPDNDGTCAEPEPQPERLLTFSGGSIHECTITPTKPGWLPALLPWLLCVLALRRRR